MGTGENKTLLELGPGSGMWSVNTAVYVRGPLTGRRAIETAKTFPKAKIMVRTP